MSSWSLRDSTGDVDSVKKTCADVLETIIMEIETFGLAEIVIPDKSDSKNDGMQLVEQALRKELSQSQLSDLLDLLKQKDVSFVDVVDKLKRFGYEVAPKILASIILDPKFAKGLMK